MKIILYKTADENVKLRKTLSEPIELNGTLRAECSVLNPSIEVEKVDSIEGEKVGSIATYNYAYIEDFGRYYYITDIVAVTDKFWKISLKVDVLMSYGDDILQLEANVLRNEYDFNLMLDDKQLNRYADDRVQCVNFPVTLSGSVNTGGAKYYLTLIGGGQ